MAGSVTRAVASTPSGQNHVFESVEELAEESVKSGFDVRYTQIGRGSFVATFPVSQIGNAVFIHETHSVPMMLNGGMDGETWMVTSCRNVILNGKRSDFCEFIVYPPGSEIHAVSDDAAAVPQVCLPADVVTRYFQATESELDCGPRAFRVPVGTELGSWFSGSVRSLVACTQPDVELAQRIESLVLGNLSESQKADAHQSSVRGKGRPVKYYDQTLKNALEYIEANLRSGLELTDLCQVSRVSLRTLRRIFIKRIGMAPSQYILICKLNAIRNELKRAEARETTVSAVALKYHLNHLGRFSASYQQLFGEYPSQTLASN